MHDWFVRNVPERVAFAVVVMTLAAVVAIAALRWMMLD